MSIQWCIDMARNWADDKNELNQRDHGIGFEEAWRVFSDEFAITAEDYIDDNGEMRYQTIGLVEGALILVAHVFRVIEEGQDEEPWIIMARKAVKYEEKIYSAHIKNQRH